MQLTLEMAKRQENSGPGEKMKWYAIILILLLAGGCAARKAPGFYGGDGSSADEAVEMVGRDYSPFLWLSENYPDSEVIFQQRVMNPISGRLYSVITFKTAEGETKKAWFRLTERTENIWG
jgi:hypothetical protein